MAAKQPKGEEYRGWKLAVQKIEAKIRYNDFTLYKCEGQQEGGPARVAFTLPGHFSDDAMAELRRRVDREIDHIFERFEENKQNPIPQPEKLQPLTWPKAEAKRVEVNPARLAD